MGLNIASVPHPLSLSLLHINLKTPCSSPLSVHSIQHLEDLFLFGFKELLC